MVNWNKIETVCIVPATSCALDCAGCYQKEQSFQENISSDKYSPYRRALNLCRSEVKDTVQEILLDLNPGDVGVVDRMEKFHFELRTVEREIGRNLKILVTTVPGIVKQLFHIPSIRFSISIHNNADFDMFERIYEFKPEVIECISILHGHKVDIHRLPQDIQTYYIIDKFSYEWEKYVLTRKSRSVIEILTEFTSNQGNIELDHCITTVLNKQSCPAYTQVNFYPDGTMRQCPYMVEEQTFDTEEFSYGCKFVRNEREKRLAEETPRGTGSAPASSRRRQIESV